MTFAPFISPARDDASRINRGRSAATNYLSIPGLVQTSQGSGQYNANYDHYAPMLVASPIVVDQLSFEVSTAEAGKNMRVGLYAADARWQPIGAPLADSGNISLTATGVKTYTPGTPLTLPRGRYLAAWNMDSNGVAALRYALGGIPGAAFNPTTLSSNQIVGQLRVSRALAAFPTPGTAWDTGDAGPSAGVFPIYLRVTAP